MTQRVVIIGGGMLGLCSAYALERRGWQVTLATERTLGYGASRVNAGWIVPAHSEPVPAPGLVRQSLKWMRSSDSPLYIQPRPSPALIRWLIDFWRHCNARDYLAGTEAIAELNKSTFRLFDEIKHAGVAFEEHCDGILYVYRSAAPFEHALREFESLAKFGTRVGGTFAGDDLHEFEPALTDWVTRGIWMEQERTVRPDTFVAGLSKYLLDHGVELRENTRVKGLELSNDSVTDVQFDHGRLETDAVLIAAGSWSPILARYAHQRLPVQGAKGYALDYAPAPVELKRPLNVHEHRHAITPMNGMIRLAGTMEFSGLNARIRPERAEAIVRGAAATLRGWPTDLHLPRVATGLRPIAPDGLPIIGLLKGYRNLAVATGHGMLGLTLAPATADAIGTLLTDGLAPEVLKPFDPARF